MRTWLLVVPMLLVHFVLHPAWSLWPIRPDLLAGALFLGALRLSWGRAAVLGGAVGLLEASIALGPLGSLMLLFAALAALASQVGHLVYTDRTNAAIPVIFAGAWLLRLGATALAGGDLSLVAALLHAPVSAGLTTALCALAERAVGRFGAP